MAWSRYIIAFPGEFPNTLLGVSFCVQRPAVSEVSNSPAFFDKWNFFIKVFFFNVDHLKKYFFEFITILLLFYVLAFWPQGMWNHSSPTRDRTHTHWWSLNHIPGEVLTTGLPGKSGHMKFWEEGKVDTDVWRKGEPPICSWLVRSTGNNLDLWLASEVGVSLVGLSL